MPNPFLKKSVMPWGKYKGKALGEIPDEYLKWALYDFAHTAPALKVQIARRLGIEWSGSDEDELPEKQGDGSGMRNGDPSWRTVYEFLDTLEDANGDERRTDDGQT